MGGIRDPPSREVLRVDKSGSQTPGRRDCQLGSCRCSHGLGDCCNVVITPRGFAPRHASAKASAMSAVALAKAELPDTLSREPLCRLAPFAWLASPGLARVFAWP